MYWVSSQQYRVVLQALLLFLPLPEEYHIPYGVCVCGGVGGRGNFFSIDHGIKNVEQKWNYQQLQIHM